MQKVMNGAELTWGITDSETNQFVGIVTISGFDRPNRIGRIDFIIDQQAANASKEMIERALKFIVDHFNFKKSPGWTNHSKSNCYQCVNHTGIFTSRGTNIRNFN